MQKGSSEPKREKSITPDLTVVVPIHNEETYLRYSLPAIYKLEPKEVILLFDRCTDRSRRVSEIIGSRYPEVRTRLITFENELAEGWASRIGAIRRYGFSLSSSDAIINTDADIVLDIRIQECLKDIGRRAGLVKLGFMDYPLNLQSFVKRLLSELTSSSSLFKGFAGIYCFSKQAWISSEDLNEAKKTEAEDSNLQIAISKRYKILYRNTASLHLRPTETKQKNFWRGMEYYNTVHASAVSVILHSLVMLRPDLLCGYLYAKRKASAADQKSSVVAYPLFSLGD